MPTDGFIGLMHVPSPRDEFAEATDLLDTLSWAETCLVEDFITNSGLTVTGSHNFLYNDGIVIDGSGVIIESPNRTGMSASSNEITRDATEGNTGGTALPILTSGTYTGDYPDSYSVEITTPGGYGSAKVTVTKDSDSTKLVDDVTITQSSDITVENGVGFSWDAAGETFDYGDSWTIVGSTGNIKYIIADVKPSNSAITLEVSLNGGSTWIELSHFESKAEEDDWNASFTGSQLMWKATSTGATTLTHLFIATGNNIPLNNWQSDTTS